METSTLFAEETEQSVAPKPVIAKKKLTITWATNFNNKMSCTGFLHLDAAPVNKPTYRQMETTLLEISTADGSHQPIVVELYDLLYLEPKQVTDAFTIASHGMTTSEFSDFIFETKPNQIAHRGIALYYYRSVEALGS